MRLRLAHRQYCHAHDRRQLPAKSAGLHPPGLDELRWIKPVFPSDTFNMKNTVTAKQESKSHPKLGIAFLLDKGFKQKDELMLRLKPIVMFKKSSG
ncbi:MAG: acyl dehydratase [Pseudohongiellaceae bacterium]|jgi:acyl dehydratase